MKKIKKWTITLISIILVFLILFSGFIAYIDPYMHFHGPLKGLQYPLKEERYVNDGILRHYDYEALITGTSMAQNFKASQFEELWGVKTVKNCYSGGSLHETADAINRAFSYQPGIKYVVRSLDQTLINQPADEDNYDGIPTYLYDRHIYNDLKYLLNKDVFLDSLAVINYTRAGNLTPDMDQYASWGQYMTYGEEEVLAKATEYKAGEIKTELTDDDREQIRDNISVNVLQIALDHPDTEFYIFIPPYSYVYWDNIYKTGQLNARLEEDELALDILFQAKNIHVFAFYGEDFMYNLDNYMDTLHYGPWISEEILSWIHEGSHEITQENKKEYFDSIRVSLEGGA